MMWARSLGTFFILASGITCARSADDRVAGMESCFQVARLADAICSKLADPTQRLDCLQKTRGAQLECLEHVLSEGPAGPSASKESSEGSPKPPANAAVPESPSKGAALKQPGPTELPTMSTEGSQPRESNSLSKANPETYPPTAPGSSPPASAAVQDGSSKETALERPDRTESAPLTTGTSSPPESNPPMKANPETNPPALPGSSPPANAAVPETPSKEVLLKQPGPAASPTISTESNLPPESNPPPQANPQTNPPAQLGSSPPTNAAVQHDPSTDISLKQPGRAEAPAGSTESGLPQTPNSPPKETSGLKPTQRLQSPEATTGAISPSLSPKPADHPTRAIGTDWVVSETTSPVDYSPLVTALIRSTSQGKDAPNTLTVRCRGQRTELVVRTDAAWGATRGRELYGGYQINDERAVGQLWILSSDGKTAAYKGDPVGLLQSVPDGALLKINMVEPSNPSYTAVFRLDGWDAVRKKVGAACKWTLTPDKASSTKR
jgi:hypothetical protein